MHTINPTLSRNTNNPIDSLLTLNLWARTNNELAIHLSEDQFKAQLAKLRLIDIRQPIRSQSDIQSGVNRHWITIRLLSALAWQRRQLNEGACELCEMLKACAKHAQTVQAVYYYRRMSEICNELCALAAKASLFEANIASQLHDLGVEDAIPYLQFYRRQFH